MIALPVIYKKILGVTGLQIASRIISILTSIILARLLGPKEFGIYGFVLSIIAIATIPVVAGLPELVVREIAKLRVEGRIMEIIGLLSWSKMYVCMVSILSFSACMFFYGNGQLGEINQEVIWFVFLLVPIKGLLARQASVLNGFQFPLLAALPSVFIAPLIFLLLLLFLMYFVYPVTPNSALTLQLLSFSISLLLGMFFISEKVYKNTLNSSFSKPIYHFKWWHKSLLPFSLMVIITTMNGELASVFLGVQGEHETVGYFRMSLQATVLMVIGLQGVNSVISPHIARLFKQGEMTQAQVLLSKSTFISVIVALPVFILLIFKAETVILFVFGSDYLSAVIPMKILCVGQSVNVLMGSVGLVLNMTGNEKKALKALFISLIVNVVLLILLTPVYKDLGAAVSVSISVALWNVLMAINAYKLTGLKTWLIIRYKGQ